MSIEHLPTPSDLLPLDIQIALRMAVAKRFDAAGAWIKPGPNEQQSTVARIDKIVAEARKRYPHGFRTD